METYTTEKYYVRFDDKEKSIYMRDLTDTANDPSAYNTKKRGYKKMKEDMLSAIEMGDRSSMSSWVYAGDKAYNMGMRTYCAMD